MLSKHLIALLLFCLAACTVVTAIGRDNGNGNGNQLGKRPLLMTFWQPEIDEILSNAAIHRTFNLVGRVFYDITIGGKRVYAVRAGMSNDNAALTAQAAISNPGFPISSIIVVGIAGSLNGMKVGDVAVPERWAAYQNNMYYAKQLTDDPVTYDADPTSQYGNHTFAFLNAGEILTTMNPGVADFKMWRQASPTLFAHAQAALAGTDLGLSRCDDSGVCLDYEPVVHIGGSGLSAPLFLDNEEYRAWLIQNPGLNEPDRVLRCHDMESASVLHVCESNGFSCIAIRSTSDLAGGDEGRNPGMKYVSIAAKNMVKVLVAYLANF
jgi:adenosylhomocysteine nucleosidase